MGGADAHGTLPGKREDFRTKLEELRAALDAVVRAEQDKDRRYWEPLKREMETFRRAEQERPPEDAD